MFESSFPGFGSIANTLDSVYQALSPGLFVSFACKSERILRIPILSHVRVLLIDENNFIRWNLISDLMNCFLHCERWDIGESETGSGKGIRLKFHFCFCTARQHGGSLLIGST